jgi:oligopeptidase B
MISTGPRVRAGSLTALLLSLSTLAFAAPLIAAPTATPAPVARRERHVYKVHGQERVDDYFWLRKKGAPEVLSYLKAENAYTQAVMKPTEAFQKALYHEMVGRIQETDVSVPYRDGQYFYYSRTVEGLEYPIYCRKSAKGAAADDPVGATAKAPEEVVLDLNEIGKQNAFVGLGAFELSDDEQTLAYAIDGTGYRVYALRFKDLRTGKLYPETIARVDSIAWAADNRTLFYVVEDPISKRSHRMYRHVLGTQPDTDVQIYDEKDEHFELTVARTRSKEYVLATSESKTTTEVRYLQASQPAAAWQVVEPRQHDHEYYVDHRGDRFYIRTNSPAADGQAKARNFRLVTAPVSSPGRAQWKELLPHSDDVMLESFEVFAGYVVVQERFDALERLRIVPLDAKGKAGTVEEVKMPEPMFSISPDENPEFDSGVFRFHFESMVRPDSVYDYDVKKRTLALRKREQVKSYDPLKYETTRIYGTASDGTRIPISLVHKKGLKPDLAHPHPMLLYGYGSYGIPMPLDFSSNRISLLDRGVVWAIAHIRGGGDLGKRWHEQGRLSTKMNTFTDFISCAERLVSAGWTAPSQLVIEGGSAGGLLMGAVTNLRPDLWKAVVAQVPFVDVINTMLDRTLPLTVGEFEEWGNPENKNDFDVMVRYSPYDNVASKPYPSILVMTSYNDSQVMYWEPTKYVAKLRALKTDRNPLLLRINMEPAGHSGVSGRYGRLREYAFEYAFVLDQLGIHQ